MATQNYVTIASQIREESTADFGYRQLHSMLTITDQVSEHKIVIPYRSLSAEYMAYLKDFILERELTEIQWQHFRHNPQVLSEAIYGTTKFWAMLLEINNCRSRMEFDKRKIKYYREDKLLEVINEIMMKEEW